MIENNFNKDLERKIDLYVNGQLNSEQTDKLWAELIQNGYYLDYMKTVANVKHIIERKRTDKKSPKVHTFKTYAKYITAAAVLMIAGVLGIMNYSNSSSYTVEPVNAIGLDVIRSAEGVPENITNDIIRKAIRLATAGNSEEAIVMLEDELASATEAQDIADISLSLGSIQYNNGNYDAAIESFQRVTDQNEVDPLVTEKGYWFLGNTYFQLEQFEQAKSAFQNAYELNGAYSRVAKTYLEALQEIKAE